MGIIKKKLNLVLKKDAYPFQKDAFDEIKKKIILLFFMNKDSVKQKLQ